MCVVCVSGAGQLRGASFVSSGDEALFPSAVEHQVRGSDDNVLLKRVQLEDLLPDLHHKMLLAME